MRPPGTVAIAIVALVAACGRIGFDPTDGVDTEPPLAFRAYLKASNTGQGDGFSVVALSGDGQTLAIAATGEDSAATGIDGVQTDDSVPDAGAVYVFVRSDASWVQQAYVKASNTGVGLDVGDNFGWDLAISADGSILAVGAPLEDSNGAPLDDSTSAAGAVYIFTRTGATWAQTAYLKAGVPGLSDTFGHSVALSADGATLAVGAQLEASAATGVNGNEADNTAPDAGAAYVFTRSGTSWSQQAFVKASNTETGDLFGSDVALSANGNTLAVGALGEASASPSDQSSNAASYSGAVYVYERVSAAWSQTAYLKASAPGQNDVFGARLGFAGDGSVLAVGATGDDSATTGIGPEAADDAMPNAGAVHVFARSSGSWVRSVYIKAPDTDTDDAFGAGLALDADGTTLLVGAPWEDSAVSGLDGDMLDRSAPGAGAAYVLRRSSDEVWTYDTYVKASNPYADHLFGLHVALSADGGVIVVGANQEDSAATGVDGNQGDHSVPAAGAVYVYW